MSRHIIVFSFCLLFSLSAFAQTLASELTPSVVNSASQPAPIHTRTTSAGVADSRISIQRLRVPHKARQLYEKALEAWIKQSPMKAQHKLDQALKLDPTFPDALTLRGGIEATNQQWGAAEESLQAAIQSDPAYSPAYVILAGVYNSQGRYDDAQEATQQALSAGTTTWSVQYEIARALIGKREYENALAVSDAALRSNHGCLMHLARAHAMLGLRKYPEAAAELRTYLGEDPAGDGSHDARVLLDRLNRLMPR
jgi:tetratricopeptide (TPR) repeat protein